MTRRARTARSSIGTQQERDLRHQTIVPGWVEGVNQKPVDRRHPVMLLVQFSSAHRCGSAVAGGVGTGRLGGGPFCLDTVPSRGILG